MSLPTWHFGAFQNKTLRQQVYRYFLFHLDRIFSIHYVKELDPS